METSSAFRLSRKPRLRTTRPSSPEATVQKLPDLIVIQHQDFSRSPITKGEKAAFFAPIPTESDDVVDCEEGVQRVPAFMCTVATRLLGETGLKLITAVENNDVEWCRSLLDSIPLIDANVTNGQSWSALHIAAMRGYEQVCEVLLDYGERVNVNSKTERLETPLHFACIAGCKRIVQALIRAGANVDVVDIEGNSPLHLVVMGKHKDILAWVLLRGPDLSIKNLEGLTAADLADSDMLNVLLAGLRPREELPCTPKGSKEGQFSRSLSTSDFSPIRKMSPQDFQILQQLGKGSFGEVFLVQKVDNNKLYAMKVLPKERIISENLIKYALTERKVTSYLKHPFIVSLNYAFQTGEKLFLVLDFCPGGDLGWHLQREKRFSEYRARLYLCEVILALEELHKRNIVYRDLKPDNVLLDAEGHAMLTDFGLSKEEVSDENLTSSFCGSIAYLAPEVLGRQAHGKAVDWYLLGVLLYEMLIGQPPYFSPDKDQLFRNIKHGRLRFPGVLSKQAKLLLTEVRIRQLLQRDPGRRLGAGRRDAEEVKEHLFFYGVKWEAVARRELRPPIPPRPNLDLNAINPDKVYGKAQDQPDNRVAGWSFIGPM